jgi:hypothetical protein
MNYSCLELARDLKEDEVIAAIKLKYPKKFDHILDLPP